MIDAGYPKYHGKIVIKFNMGRGDMTFNLVHKMSNSTKQRTTDRFQTSQKIAINNDTEQHAQSLSL